MRFEPLLAAGNDWVVALVTIVLPVIIWGLNQAFGQLNQKRPGQPRAGQQPPTTPAGQSPEDEVQEFLRRVRQRREEVESMEILGRPKPQPANPPKAPAKSKQRERSGKSREQRPVIRTPLQPSTPSSSTKSDAGSRRPLGSRLSEQVAKDIDTSDVTERARQLSKLDQADEQMEARIQSHFNRKLGSLESTASAEPESAKSDQAAEGAAASLAEQLLTQIRNPEGLRQAVLMREIFDRPTHRWQ